MSEFLHWSNIPRQTICIGRAIANKNQKCLLTTIRRIETCEISKDSTQYNRSSISSGICDKIHLRHLFPYIFPSIFPFGCLNIAFRVCEFEITIKPDIRESTWNSGSIEYLQFIKDIDFYSILFAWSSICKISQRSCYYAKYCIFGKYRAKPPRYWAITHNSHAISIIMVNCSFSNLMGLHFVHVVNIQFVHVLNFHPRRNL